MTSNEVPIIYTSAICGWAIRNYAAFYEKGVAFTAVDVKHAPADQIQVFREMFPYAKTPSLLHGNTRVWESLVINEYINEAFAGPSLLPRDAAGKASARLWMYHCDSMLFPELSRALRASSEDERIKSTEILKLRIDDMDRMAQSTAKFAPYWSGREIGLVDFCYHIFLDALSMSRETLGNDMPALPQWLREWEAAIASASSIQRAKAFAATLPMPKDAYPAKS
ncbi:MAG: hypothetical protein DCC73_09905 [Proteobacteria bacterium]|nr:MAG: hypothetical protein DCC73_09905 [Pseudomonadota bacterium]